MFVDLTLRYFLHQERREKFIGELQQLRRIFMGNNDEQDDTQPWPRGSKPMRSQCFGLSRRSFQESRAVHPNITCDRALTRADVWEDVRQIIVKEQHPNMLRVSPRHKFFSSCWDKSKTVWRLLPGDAYDGCLLFLKVHTHGRLISITCLKQTEDAAQPQQEMEEMLIMLVPHARPAPWCVWEK